MENYVEVKEAELKDSLTLVWLGEYYHRSKRLPNLQDELKKISGDSKKIMSNNEMLETVKLLNAQFGGTFIKGGE